MTAHIVSAGQMFVEVSSIQEVLPSVADANLLNSLITPEADADCRAFLVSLINLRNMAGDEPTSEMVNIARSYVRKLTEEMDIVAGNRLIRMEGPQLGDEDRVRLGLGPADFLTKVHCDALHLRFIHPKQDYGFGRVDLDMLRMYAENPSTVPVGGFFTVDMKLKIIALRLNYPLGGFHHDMFRVKIGDLQKNMFCLFAGSMADENPTYLELAPTPEVSLMLRKREFQILVPFLCSWCGKEPRPLKQIYLVKCGGCRKVSYCDKECQRKDWSRDHGPSRKDGKPRQAYVPSKGWCAHMRSKKLGVIMPVMSYNAYMGLVE